MNRTRTSAVRAAARVRSARRHHVLLAISLAVAIVGCEDKRKPTAAAGKPPVVTVAKAVQIDFQPHVDFTGRTEAVEEVEVRPRVSGFLESISFQSGKEVEKGELLFEIDARPYKAEVDRLEAELSSATSRYDQSQVEYERLKDLFEKESATKLEYDRHVAMRDSAKAQVAAAAAALERAKLDLEWTRVTAPITGRISRNYVDIGNLVQGGYGASTLLSRIVRFDPMFAYIDIDERTMLLIQKMVREGKMERYSDTNCAARLGLAIEEGFPHQGGIDFVENKVDANTGTLRVRAVFPNPDNVLSPGLFARIRILLGESQKAIMISERAIGFDQGQRFVYVVNDKNTVDYRVVRVGDLDNGMRVIEEGVRPDEWVIVNGLQRVRPGVQVEPHRVDMMAFIAPQRAAAGAASQPAASTTTQSN